MLLTLGRGMSGVARAQGQDPRKPLNHILPSCVFDLDATIATSYNGAGGVWNNMIAAPADGASQSAYNFMRGNGSTGTTYPTFTGTADNPDCYWALDGGDYFTIQNSVNTSYLAGLQRTDIPAQAYTMFCALYFTDPDALAIKTVFATSSNTATIGVRFIISQDSGNETLVHYQRGGSANTTSGMPRPVLTPDRHYVIGISRESGGSVTRLWVNDSYSELSHTANSCTSDTASPFQLGANGASGSRFSSGTRIYAVSMFKKFVTNTEAQKIIAAYRKRHKRSYS